MRTTKEVLAEIEIKSRELRDKFAQAGSCKSGDGNGIIEEITRREAELVTLEGELKSARDYEGIRERNEARLAQSAKATNVPNAPQFPMAQPTEIKSLGQTFFEAATKAVRSGNRAENSPYTIELKDADIVSAAAMAAMMAEGGMKTTMSTGAGFAPFSPRTARIVDSAQRRPVVASLIPQNTTEYHSVPYMKETTFTNNVATAAEGSAGGESALAWTEVTPVIEKVSTWLPITDEQIDDVPGLMNLVDRRLMLMWGQEEEDQLVNGDGSSPNLTGFLADAAIQTQAMGSDLPQDAVYKAFTKVRHTAYAEPTGVVIHPDNWTPIRLYKTADGLYVYGAPSEAGPETLFGKPVVQTKVITSGTALTGDFQMDAEITRRQGATIEVGYINTDFKDGKKTIKLTAREVLKIFRGASFCKVTGLST